MPICCDDRVRPDRPRLGDRVSRAAAGDVRALRLRAGAPPIAPCSWSRTGSGNWPPRAGGRSAGRGKRVRRADGLAEALPGVDFVQENTPEALEAKRGDLRRARCARAAGRRSSRPRPRRSSHRRFTENARRPRALPRRASGQSAAPRARRRAVRRAVDGARDGCARARRSTSRSGRCRSSLSKEIEGFILNRLQGALLAEAFRLVGEGYVSPQDSTRRSRTDSACAGRSWGRSRPSSSMHPAAWPTTARATPASTAISRPHPRRPKSVARANVRDILGAVWGAGDARAAGGAHALARRSLAALRAHKKSQPEA